MTNFTAILFCKKTLKKLTTWMLALSASIIFSLSANADQLDPRLNDLFLQLQDSGHLNEALQIENQIWQTWLDNDNAQFSELMMAGIELMNRGSMYQALDNFDHLIEIAPDYSEAWNKRATIYYILGNLEESEADIVQTLMLEPYHFGALSGRGLVYMAKGDMIQARRAFNAALEVHPYLQGARSSLQAIDRSL